MTTLDPSRSQMLREAGGAPVNLVDPQTHTDYVVLRADIYERVKSLLEADDLSDEEKRRLLAKSGRRAGWDAPEMDDYDAHCP